MKKPAWLAHLARRSGTSAASRTRVYADKRLLATQIIASILGRKGRAALTASGIAVGVVVFIMTYGWTLAGGAIINATFDETVATLISVKARENTEASLGADFTQHVEDLDGVVAAGRWANSSQLACSGHPGQQVTLPSVIADAGYFDAAGAQLASGRFYDATTPTSGPVAVLGPGAASQLGISEVSGGSVVVCQGVTIPVYGVLADAGEAIALGPTIVLSSGLDGTSLDENVPGQEVTGAVRAELGATQVVAKVLPLHIDPAHAGDIAVTIPPSPEQLRADVTGSLNTLAIGVSVLSLVVGGIGIMTTMLTSVMERTREIGLRRALGARPHHIASQFVIEGVVYGLVGATTGLAIGLVGLLIMVSVKGWTPVMEPVVALGVLPAGCVVGGLAALIPGIRAARIPPATALRAN